MSFETKLILSKIQTEFTCVIDGEECEFASFEEFEREGLASEYDVMSIGIKGGKIIVNMVKHQSNAAELALNEEWAKRHKKAFGEEPSFF